MGLVGLPETWHFYICLVVDVVVTEFNDLPPVLVHDRLLQDGL